MKVFILPLTLLSIISCDNSQTKHETVAPTISASEPAPVISYTEAKHNIDSIRINLKKKYLKASEQEKQILLIAAKSHLIRIINEDFYSYWKGTPWNFNGVTTTPKKGSIACGYFVTGLLQDAGYKLKRIKLSTCASMIMMKELTSSKHIKSLSSLSYKDFDSWVKDYGKGLFIVGLDFHTGFIVNDGNDVWFIHSNYINNIGVVKEKVSESLALKSSKTRHLTCLSDNKQFLKNWILN